MYPESRESRVVREPGGISGGYGVTEFLEDNI